MATNDYDDCGFYWPGVDQYNRERNNDLRRQIEKDLETIAAGKIWTHTCPECGKTFQSHAPGKDRLCDECGRKKVQELRDEWE